MLLLNITHPSCSQKQWVSLETTAMPTGNGTGPLGSCLSRSASIQLYPLDNHTAALRVVLACRDVRAHWELQDVPLLQVQLSNNPSNGAGSWASEHNTPEGAAAMLGWVKGQEGALQMSCADKLIWHMELRACFLLSDEGKGFRGCILILGATPEST